MIDAEGGISEAIQTDVTDEESVRQAVAKTVELFGAVHILVNIGKFLDPPHPPSFTIMTAHADHLTRYSRRRRRPGRRHKARPSRLGPRPAHKRDQHGPHEPSRHPRDAQIIPRRRPPRRLRHSQHVLGQRHGRRQPEPSLCDQQGRHHPDDEGDGGAPRQRGHPSQLRRAGDGVHADGEDPRGRHVGGDEAGEDRAESPRDGGDCVGCWIR